MSKSLLLLLTLLCIVNINVLALKCYICATTQDALDPRCMNNPESLPDGVRACSKNYCTSIRVEYIDPKDKVQSIVRQCEDKPQFINEVFEDSTFRTYFKACQTDLCNGGTGKGFSNIGGYTGDTGEAIVLLVPGIGFDSATSVVCNTFLVIVISFYFIVQSLIQISKF